MAAAAVAAAGLAEAPPAPPPPAGGRARRRRRPKARALKMAAQLRDQGSQAPAAPPDGGKGETPADDVGSA